MIIRIIQSSHRIVPLFFYIFILVLLVMNAYTDGTVEKNPFKTA